MKIRSIAAFSLIPIVILIALLTPKIVTAICLGLMCAIAVHELLKTTRLVRHSRMLIYTMVTAFLVSIWCYLGCSAVLVATLALVLFVLLFFEVMLSDMKVSYTRISLCLTSGLVLPYMLCAIVRILMLPEGRSFVLLPFALAFVSDSFAYLTGIKFGKRKLAPTISPKKTIEGLVGGLIATILSMVIYGLVLQLSGFKVNYIYAVLYAVIGTAAGTFGDLCFSVIKRQTNIKDYGNLIPGHGGIVDRFDSMYLIAPLVELLLYIIPVAVKV